jgi:predicted ATP-grasp superfamily ATP-dependent carboligase
MTVGTFPATSRATATRTPGAVIFPDNLAALGVCRSLGPHGVPCTVLSGDRTTPGQYSRYGRRLAAPASLEDRELVERLVELGRAQGERPVLFLTDDATLVAVHRHRAVLEEWYRFPMAPWSVLRRVIFKDALYREMDGVVPVPRTAVLAGESAVADAAGTVGFPAVVKPFLRFRSAAREPGEVPFEKLFGAKAVRVQGRDDLGAVHRLARSHGFDLLAQEEIPGPVSSLVSVGLYATRDAVAAAFTARKLGQVPADFGDGLIVEATREPALIALAAKAVRHFGYHGMADIEFKRDARDGTYKLLDINPRPWLWINLPTVCGVNLPYAAYLDALGRPLDHAAFAQRDFQTRWVSGRGVANSVVRALLAGRLREMMTTLRIHGRRPRVGPLYAPGDSLTGMFLNPAFWWQSLRQAAANVRTLRASPAARGMSAQP